MARAHTVLLTLISGYALAQTLPGCLEVTSRPNNSPICSKCMATYYLSNGACLKQNVPRCRVFISQTNKCKECLKNYVLENGICTKANDVLNCALTYTWLGITKCTHCKAGYYLDSMSSCKAQDVANCGVHANNQNLCLECKEGMYMNAAKVCVAQTVANCAMYHVNTNICKECKPKHALISLACVAQNVANCEEYNDGSTTCKTCKDTHVAVNGLCVLKVANCKEHKATGCQLCDPGYYLLNNGQCALQNVADCNTYEPNKNVCIECKFYFILKDNMCKKGPENCLETTDDKLSCVVCSKNHVLTPAKMCTPGSIAGCKDYITNLNECDKCEPGLVLITNPSHKCSEDIIVNCKDYKDNGDCEKCKPGHYLSDDSKSCPPQDIANCQTHVENSSACELCAEGYFAVDPSTCEKIVANCETFTENTNDCELCKKDYYMVDAKTCSAVSVANCMTYTPNTNDCVLCKAEHYLTNPQTCTPGTVLGCQIYETAADVCVTCKENHIQDTNLNTCTLVVANCLLIEKNACRQCEIIYRPGDDNNQTCVEHRKVQLEMEVTDGNWLFLDYHPTFSTNTALGVATNPGDEGRFIRLLDHSGVRFKIIAGETNISLDDLGLFEWSGWQDPYTFHWDAATPDVFFLQCNFDNDFLNTWSTKGGKDITNARPVRRTWYDPPAR